jgi:G3E family GTPase
VDAMIGVGTLGREKVSQKQVALADRIVLTKIDLAGAAEPALLRRLVELNAGAPVLYAEHGRVEPQGLFDVSLYDPSTESLDVNSWLADDANGPAHHDTDIKAYAIVRTDPIPAVVLTLFLEALAEHCGADLLRLKGIVHIAESPERPAVIHGVQHVFHAPAWLERWPSDERRSRIILITRHIPKRWVEVLLDAIAREVAQVSVPS